MDRQAEIALIESLWERIREHLENERQRVNEEIKNYPPPIPACDAQFNYLLEERGSIAQELVQSRALPRENLTPGGHLERIGEFIASSNYIKGEAEQSIRSSLLKVLDGDV